MGDELIQLPSRPLLAGFALGLAAIALAAAGLVPPSDLSNATGAVASPTPTPTRSPSPSPTRSASPPASAGPSPNVVVKLAGAAKGTVVDDTGAIFCGDQPGATRCAARLPAGEEIRLYPATDYGLVVSADASYFAGWRGSGFTVSDVRYASFTIGAPVTLTAAFEPATAVTIQAGGPRPPSDAHFGFSSRDAGGEWGEVTCVGSCPERFPPGATVTVRLVDAFGAPVTTAAAANGFRSWSGVPGCSTGYVCTLTVGSAAITLTAVYGSQ